MALTDRETEFNRIVDQMQASEEKGLYSQLLDLCDTLAANYRDLLDVDRTLFLKGVRGRAYLGLGRYEEAKCTFGEILEYNIAHGLPLASSTHMYRWLCAYYKGDEQRALQEHIKLTDQGALDLLKVTREGHGGRHAESRGDAPRELAKCPVALGPLIEALGSTDVHVRARAAEALGQLKDPGAVPALIGVLSDASFLPRNLAASALGDIGDPVAVEALTAFLQRCDPSDWSGLACAAGALGDIGDWRAMEPLIGLLGNKKRAVREAAADALTKMSGQAFGEDLSRWEGWWRRNKSAVSGGDRTVRAGPAPLFRFQPVCLRCGSHLAGPVPFTSDLPLGGGVACSKCGERHDYRIVGGRLTLSLEAVVLGYTGPRERVFDPIPFPPKEAGAEPTIEQAEAGAPEPPAAVEPVEAEAPRRGRPLLTLAIILVAAVVLIGLAHRYASRQVPINAGPAGEGLGQPAPDFMVKDIRGNTFKLSELKGRVVILDFWATWCQPCKIEIPWFVDMYNRYKTQGLEVVGVAMDDEGAEVVKPFAERYRMNYKVVIGNEKITDLFGGIYGLPTTFIIDREGKIHSRHIGLVSRETLEQAVKKLL